MPRHEHYRRLEDGTTELVQVVDDRDVDDARAEKRQSVIVSALEDVSETVQSRLGCTRAQAQAIAATLLLEALPPMRRQRLQNLVDRALADAVSKLQQIDDAVDVEAVDRL